MSAPILSAYDWEMSQGFIRHLRAGFLDATNNGKLQFRYVYPDGTVEWINLLEALTSVNFNFTSWWSPAELLPLGEMVGYGQSLLLFVNGLPRIWEWSGGITTLASVSNSAAAVSTITDSGFRAPDSWGGSGYTVGDILTITTGNNNAKVIVDTIAYGGITSATLNAAGSTYSALESVEVVTTLGTGFTLDVFASNGAVVDTFISNAGTGYIAGDTVIIVAGNRNAILTINSVSGPGGVLTYSLTSAGSGYSSGNGFSTSGGTGAFIAIDTVTGGGGVATYHLVSQGSGYVSKTGAKTNYGGSGSGFTVNIVAADGVITLLSITNGGTGYSVSSANPVSGGTGTGALINITAIANNTITKQGTTTWAEEGFYSHGTHYVIINGIAFTVTSGWNSTTLTGVTPDPTGAGVAGDVVFQEVEYTLNRNMPAGNNATPGTVPITFSNDLISTFDQQLYLGSLTANSIFVSWADDYRYFNFDMPRFTGQGLTLTTNAPPKAFIVQEELLYVSAGVSQWYTVSQDNLDTPLVVSSNIVPLNVVTPTLHRLKTTGLQGAQSQAFVGKNKNDVVFVSFEPICNSLGRVDNILVTPQISDLSFSIVNDMNKYDFTDGCIFFWKNFIFVAVPKEGLFRMYNMTKDTTTQNPTNDPIHYWEAPLTIPLSRFSIIDGELYGHSYLVSETYKLFDGYNFNNHAIPALAVFAYNQYGVRPQNKSENEFYVEGYISSNTTLDMTINYELDGYGGQYNGTIEGTDSSIVQTTGGLNSLGKESLGKNPLGGDLVLNPNNTDKFRVIKTFPRTPYYEASPSFGSTGIDNIWSLIGFGPAQSPTTEGNNPITQ